MPILWVTLGGITAAEMEAPFGPLALMFSLVVVFGFAGIVAGLLFAVWRNRPPAPISDTDLRARIPSMTEEALLEYCRYWPQESQARVLAEAELARRKKRPRAAKPKSENSGSDD